MFVANFPILFYKIYIKWQLKNALNIVRHFHTWQQDTQCIKTLWNFTLHRIHSAKKFLPHWFQSDLFPLKIKYVREINIAFNGLCTPINYTGHMFTQYLFT